MNDKEYINGMSKARKRGAQKGNSNAKKNDPLNCRLALNVTNQEKKLIERDASLQNISVSNYLRNHIPILEVLNHE